MSEESLHQWPQHFIELSAHFISKVKWGIDAVNNELLVLAVGATWGLTTTEDSLFSQMWQFQWNPSSWRCLGATSGSPVLRGSGRHFVHFWPSEFWHGGLQSSYSLSQWWPTISPHSSWLLCLSKISHVSQGCKVLTKVFLHSLTISHIFSLHPSIISAIMLADHRLAC